MMADVERLRTDSDLSENGFVDAVAMLKVMPDQTVLVCAHENACEAHKIRASYGCQVLLVPKEMLLNEGHAYNSQGDVWCVMHGVRAVWSPGA